MLDTVGIFWESDLIVTSLNKNLDTSGFACVNFNRQLSGLKLTYLWKEHCILIA